MQNPNGFFTKQRRINHQQWLLQRQANRISLIKQIDGITARRYREVLPYLLQHRHD
jgi:hypothetical protein